MTKQQSPALDLLRALAAVEVLLVHVRGGAFVEYGALPTSQQTIPTFIFYASTRLGQEAVMVFFVLSGFLVGGQVVDRMLRDTFDVRRYALDRATRILLPLVPSVLLAAGIQSWSSHAPSGIDVLGNMVGLNDLMVPTLAYLPPLWSLTYEIWFYIFAGAVGLVGTRQSLTGAFLICICLLVFAKLSALYLCFWCLGVLASRFRELQFTQTCVAAILAVPIAALGIVAFQISFSSKSFENREIVSSQIALALIAISIAMCIPFLTSERISKLLSPIAGIAGAMAAFSYTLYLSHYPIEMALEHWLVRAPSITTWSLAMFGVRLAIALVVAGALYWLFERNTKYVRNVISDRYSRTGQVRTSL